MKQLKNSASKTFIQILLKSYASTFAIFAKVNEFAVTLVFALNCGFAIIATLKLDSSYRISGRSVARFFNFHD